MSKFKLKLTGISDETKKPQTLEMEAYAKDAEELAARLDKEFNLKLDENGWSMYIEWLSDDDSKLEDAWDTGGVNVGCDFGFGESELVCWNERPRYTPMQTKKAWERMMYDYLVRGKGV